MTRTKRIDLWLIAGTIVVGLGGGALAGAVAFFSLNTENATWLAFFRNVLQPFATATLGAIYLWHDLLHGRSTSDSVAESSSAAGALASAAPQITIQNILQNQSAGTIPHFDEEQLRKVIDAALEETEELKTGTLTAKNIVITGKDGKRQIFLGADEFDNPMLAILDKDGKFRALLSVFEFDGAAEPQLALIDRKGNTRFYLELNNDYPIMNIIGPDLKSQSFLTASSSGPIIALYDESKEMRAMLTRDVLSFYDKDKNLISKTPADGQ